MYIRTKMKNFLTYIILLLLCCFACNTKQEKKQYTIAFSQCIGDDAWRQTMLEEMKRELSFHPDIKFIFKDAAGNNENQVAQIRELLKQDIDLLIVSPNEAEPLTPIVDSVFQLKIPVIVTDRKTSSGLYNAYVGADNIAIGKLAGHFISNNIQASSNIGILTGLQGTSASIERKEGLLMALDSAAIGHINLELNGDWSRKTAYTLSKNEINSLLKQDIILAFNDQSAFGVVQALKETGKEYPKVIGIDALAGKGNGLEAVYNGELFASVLYPTGGTEAIRTAVAILEKMPYKRENILGTLVISKENANLMMLQSNKIAEQQNDIDNRQNLIDEQKRIYHDQQTTLNIVIISLVLAVIFGGISIIVIKSNWEKNKHLENQNQEILSQKQQIVDMNQQIQNAADEQSKFFTNVSHELKTPLTLIMAPIEELEKQISLNDQAKSHLKYIKRYTQKLHNLIKDLIDIHRMDKAKIKLQANEVNIDSYIQQIISNFKPLAQKNRISISYMSKTSIKEIWFDEYLMEQAFSNLLSNAFNYSFNGGKISIHVEENTFGDYILIKIIDNGAGISTTDIEHIFDNFYQGEQHFSGSGIGLAYVKQIIELHHGQVTVSSKKGVGSSFTLRLPTGSDHLSKEEIKVLDSKETNYANSHILNQENVLDMEEDTVSFHSSKSANLLIVEDNQDIRQFLKVVLEKDYNIIFAKNYNQAIAKMEKNYPDLIISDIMLPDESGFELLKTVKNNFQFNQIPVIILSALDTEESQIQSLKLFADAYITKPFRTEYLKTLIFNLINTRKTLKDHYTNILKNAEVNDDDLLHTEQEKRFLQNLALVVEKKLGDKTLSVEDVASDLNISRVQLYRKTKSLLNCSVNEYIMQKRLSKSKHLLLEGFHINEIAEKTGFSSGAYFTAAFKKAFDTTPTAFRKQILKK